MVGNEYLNDGGDRLLEDLWKIEQPLRNVLPSFAGRVSLDLLQVTLTVEMFRGCANAIAAVRGAVEAGKVATEVFA